MSKKCPLSRKAALNLLKVVEWLESGAPHVTAIYGSGTDVVEFSMSYGVRASGCGTACCIAGAVVEFNNPFTKEEMRESFKNSGSYEMPWAAVKSRAFELLDLDMDDNDDCHMAHKLFLDGYGNQEWITPAIAAKVLRQFMETGEICWMDYRPDDWELDSDRTETPVPSLDSPLYVEGLADD